MSNIIMIRAIARALSRIRPILILIPLILSFEESWANDLVRNEDTKRLSSCAAGLNSFVAEIDRLIPATHSVVPLQDNIRRYFPLYGCNIDEAISICGRSEYFDHSEWHKDVVIIIFRRKIPNGWGFKISFGLSTDTGNSELPSAEVDKAQ